jgi:hypothetical protein
MNASRRVACLATSVLLVTSAVAPLFAQNAGQTASQFYLAYRAAFDKAKSIEELLPFLSKQSADRVKATPAGERPKMFELMKMMGTLTAVKVLKETKNGDGATLSVEGVDADKAKTKGTIEIVKEGGAWKLGGESWSSAAS